MINNLNTEQIENVQIDYGLIFINYGEEDARKVGPTRGGGEFTATKNIRDIDYDGRLGKTKGLQAIDEINAMLKVGILDTTLDTLILAMPQAALSEERIVNNVGGIIDGSKYLKNITMFCKVIGGGYKKITLYNAMNESDFSLNAAPKAEGVINLEVYAHWDPQDIGDLYTIEDIPSLAEDTTPPTVVTSPSDEDTGVPVDVVLTAEFDKEIKYSDINSGNLILINLSDQSIVDGSLSYNTGTRIAAFTPASNLAFDTQYLWTIARVRDVVGNVMDPVAVKFTTESE